MMKERSTFADFEPHKPLHTPLVLMAPLVRKCLSHSDPKPFHYWWNGYQRHHKKLTGMAGNIKDK